VADSRRSEESFRRAPGIHEMSQFYEWNGRCVHREKVKASKISTPRRRNEQRMTFTLLTALMIAKANRSLSDLPYDFFIENFGSTPCSKVLFEEHALFRIYLL
jgi:hypothetical protein